MPIILLIILLFFFWPLIGIGFHITSWLTLTIFTIIILSAIITDLYLKYLDKEEEKLNNIKRKNNLEVFKKYHGYK